MHQINQLLYKPVFFLLLAIAAIAAIWKVEIKWIALPVFLTAGLIIIYQLHKLSILFEIKYRIAREDEHEKNILNEKVRVPWSQKKENLLYYTMQAIFFLSIIVIRISGKEVENYLYWKTFAITTLIVGCLVDYLSYRLFLYYVDPVFSDEEKETHVKVAVFVIPVMICFHGMVLLNKFKPSAIVSTTNFIVSKKGENYRYGNKYIFLNIDNKQVRFEIPKNDFMKIRETDTVTIVTRKGALGFNYVDSFTVKPNL